MIHTMAGVRKTDVDRSFVFRLRWSRMPLCFSSVHDLSRGSGRNGHDCAGLRCDAMHESRLMYPSGGGANVLCARGSGSLSPLQKSDVR